MKYYTSIDTIIGSFVAICENNALIRISSAEEFHRSDDMLPGDEVPLLCSVRNWMDDYTKGNVPSLACIPLNPSGTPFQKAVWDHLLKIPYGHSETYGRIAKIIALSMNKAVISAQAIGGAVGKNPIPFIIPCHRVLGSNGSLTGFRYGTDKKAMLLKHENIPYK